MEAIEEDCTLDSNDNISPNLDRSQNIDINDARTPKPDEGRRLAKMPFYYTCDRLAHYPSATPAQR